MQVAIMHNQPTMSSREIADLLEKQHANIKISAERLAEKGVIGTLATQEFTHNGNTYTGSARERSHQQAALCPAHRVGQNVNGDWHE